MTVRRLSIYLQTNRLGRYTARVMVPAIGGVHLGPDILKRRQAATDFEEAKELAKVQLSRLGINADQLEFK